jgi:catechol 2,3-dioxygenase-like lactoylglutathione lyase family enzyme
VIRGIDHVQVAAPPGCEAAARAFYGGLLGMAEVEKPAELAGRGGCWFAAGGQQLHVGVAEPFRPAEKAHPALVVESGEELRAISERLEAAGHPTRWDDAVAGWVRFHVADPFGNRVELVARASVPGTDSGGAS